MAMYLPPTPPDDRVLLMKNPATPPAVADPLTPDSTPPGMRRGLRHASNDLSKLRSEAIPPTENKNESTSSAATILADPVQREGRTPEVPGAFKEAEWDSYIPVSEREDGSAARSHVEQHHHDAHANESLLPVFSSSATESTTPLTAHDFPVRQRPRRRMRNAKLHTEHPQPVHQPTSSAPQSADWNDVPADMISNNEKQEEVTAHNHTTPQVDYAKPLNAAVEVVVLQPQIHSPSLRHIKKCHSLRMRVVDNATSTVTSNTRRARDQAGSDPAFKSLGSQQHTLKHRKAFEPVQHTPMLPNVLGVASAVDHRKSAHILRHERRPLSAGNRSQDSSHREPLSNELHASSKRGDEPQHVPPPSELQAQSSEAVDSHDIPNGTITTRDNGHGNLIAGQETSTPKITSSPYVSPRLHSALSPSAKSQRFANTPMSGISDRTEMEVCVAKDVILFPHSNDSVTLIENNTAPAKKAIDLPIPLAPRTFRPLSFTFEDPESASTSSTESLSRRSFSTPEIQINGTVHTVDSPLTNPRAAPVPPAINFIPPTPSSELDRQLSPEHIRLASSKPPQRSNSLLYKARRFSGSLITPFFPRAAAAEAHRPSTSRSAHDASLGNDRLHPMWVPTHTWHYDNEEEEDYHDDDDCYDDEDYDHLPPGGDTSEHPAERKGLFPRQMSVRMPGFRGNGGFLLGNSLGFERHGSNRRRHYVDIPAQGKHSPTGRFAIFKTLKNRVSSTRQPSRQDAVAAAAAEKKRAALQEAHAATNGYQKTTSIL